MVRDFEKEEVVKHAKGYSGEFCEVWETSEEEICDGGGVNATMNYPQNSSLLMLKWAFFQYS